MRFSILFAVLLGMPNISNAEMITNTPFWLARTFEITSQKGWYIDGSLHKADTSKWRNASVKNKLATAADFYTKFNPDIVKRRGTGPKGLGAEAFGLVVCIDAAIEGVSMPSIAEIAALCHLLIEK